MVRTLFRAWLVLIGVGVLAIIAVIYNASGPTGETPGTVISARYSEGWSTTTYVASQNWTRNAPNGPIWFQQIAQLFMIIMRQGSRAEVLNSVTRSLHP